MSAEGCVKLLGIGVGLIPPGLTQTCDIGADGEATDVIVGHRAECMLRHERHIFVVVIPLHFQIGIIIRTLWSPACQIKSLVVVELGIGEAIGKSPIERIVEEPSAKCRFQSAGMALAGIDHHTAIVGTRNHLRELLVADLHVENGKVEVQL